jgi:hypothetical protein
MTMGLLNSIDNQHLQKNEESMLNLSILLKAPLAEGAGKSCLSKAMINLGKLLIRMHSQVWGTLT